MVSKIFTNILLWFSFVCWIVILPVLIYCDSDEVLQLNIGFGYLFKIFKNFINLLSSSSFDQALEQGPYIVAIFTALILFLFSLAWLIPCLKAKKRKTMIISAVNLGFINMFFIIIFIVLICVEVKIGGYTFALYVVAEKEGFSVYQTPFFLLLPFIITISILIPYIIRIVNVNKDLSVNDNDAKIFNTQRKAAIKLNKGKIGATGKKAAKTMVSNQELEADPASVNDLKSKVNRLKMKLESKDYTNSFQTNIDEHKPSYDNNGEKNNDYVPTSELFIRPARAGQAEANSKANFTPSRNADLKQKTYGKANIYGIDDNDNDLPPKKGKVTSNFEYLASGENPSDETQPKSSSQILRNQHPFNISPEKTVPRTNRAIVDTKYNNKIIIGDTDKIWNATKKAREQYSKSENKDE